MVCTCAGGEQESAGVAGAGGIKGGEQFSGQGMMRQRGEYNAGQGMREGIAGQGMREGMRQRYRMGGGIGQGGGRFGSLNGGAVGMNGGDTLNGNGLNNGGDGFNSNNGFGQGDGLGSGLQGAATGGMEAGGSGVNFGQGMEGGSNSGAFGQGMNGMNGMRQRRFRQRGAFNRLGGYAGELL